MFPDLMRDDVFRLETRRLWLRWPRQADVAAVVRQAGEQAVAEMTGSIPHPYAPHEAEAFVVQARRGNAEGRALAMAVAPRARPTDLVGVVGIRPDAEGVAELGYWMGIPHWGRGLATEAVRALVDAFFAYAAGTALRSTVRTINPASRRVLEKAGFAHAGTDVRTFPARGAILPIDHFHLDRRAWEGLQDGRPDGLVTGRPRGEGTGRATLGDREDPPRLA